MASSGITAWNKYFNKKGDVTTTIGKEARVTSEKGDITKLLKDTNITVIGGQKYGSLIKIKYNKNKIGYVSFGSIAKPGSSTNVKSILKPSDVRPSIVDTWIEAEQMVANVKKYLKSLDAISQKDKDVLNKLLDRTLASTNSDIDISDLNTDVAPAEFYEILTSIKMASLLKSNDAKIRKILSVPKKLDLSKLKVKINIPLKANMPLMDYEISLSSSSNPNDITMKVSVKSKVKGKSTNTIKFTDAFDNVNDIKKFDRSLSTAERKNQKGQKIVAESAITTKQRLMYPITALDRLFDDSASLSLIKTVMNDSFTTPENFSMIQFKNSLKTLAKKLDTVKKTDMLGEVIKSEQQLTNLVAYMMANLRTSDGKSVKDLTVLNASLLCEKIIAKASEKKFPKGLNFYLIFWTQVLKEKQIAYAIAKKDKNKIKYMYFSSVNWKTEYSDWVRLRSKNLINSLNDTLGMEID